MGSKSEVQEYWAYFTDDTLAPVPIRARGRPSVFSIGRKYEGPFGKYRGVSVAAAVGVNEGESFEDVADDEFVTEVDV